MKIYFLRVNTESGLRYVGDRSKGLITTLHPSNARKLDLNQSLPADVASLVDAYGSAEFVLVSQARCLHDRCNCTWSDEKPQVR
ncbi:MAG: hypothetical protein MOB07_16390 [Acidobacteria bacterium]|nr:hypothetical protein [Acidobacteriota bacterium]